MVISESKIVRFRKSFSEIIRTGCIEVVLIVAYLFFTEPFNHNQAFCVRPHFYPCQRISFYVKVNRLCKGLPFIMARPEKKLLSPAFSSRL